MPDPATRPAAELAQVLGVAVDDLDLLERSLTHRSFAFENGGLIPNERLEFLGDAVLALVVTDEVFHLKPDAPEGQLAKIRAAAVKTASLAAVARELDLGSFVKLGRGEANSGGADKESILADTLEAVIGAIYIGQGYDVATDLVRRLFAAHVERLSERIAALDYKTSLQELTAARFETLPVYRVTDDGPDHEKTFTASVTVAGRKLGDGHGRSKKEAEQRAARLAYLALIEELDGTPSPVRRPRRRGASG